MPDLHARPSMPILFTGWRRPVLLLVLVFGMTWLALVLRGLDLGFTGDLLDYAFHYDRLGTFGGMRWLISEHLQRHLLAGLVSAPIAYIFPAQSAPWYAYLFLVHFVDAILVFFLADTLLRGRSRWVSVASALLFAFHVVQVPTLFDFPTGGHRTTALGLALLSLWAYVVYRRRDDRRWLELSFLAYALAILMYEQTVLFFLLHPVLAFVESTRDRGQAIGLRWLARVALDSALFPLFVAGYLFLLRILFPPSEQLSFSPGHLLDQLIGGIQQTIGPAPILTALMASLTAMTLIVVAGGVLVFVLLHVLQRQTQAGATASRRDVVALVAIGLCIVLASILGVAPSEWRIVDNPRSVYAASVGIGFVVAGGLSLLVGPVAANRPRAVIAALIVALFVGAGIGELVSQQDVTQARTEIRNRFIMAVRAAIPDVNIDDPPYLLIYTDANPSTDLWLFAQDNRFPLTFDWLYGTTDMPVDVIYANLDESLAPSPMLPGSLYNGQFIVAEAEGIYSPLKPYVPIDPDRLVILHYDSQSGIARVVDALPDAVRATANIVERAPVAWRTRPDALLPGVAP